MNILVVNGSPRAENSNSMQLTRAFLDGADYGAEIITVTKLRIKPCLGCFACWQKTPGQCAIKDDMAEVLNKIIAADMIIWSFPLYYFSLPGALKNFIDRSLPLNLPFMSDDAANGGHPPRYDLSRQRYAVISTCGFWRSEGNYDGVTAIFDHMYGCGNYGKIFCGQGELFRFPELRDRTREYLELVRKAGAEFAKGGIRPETQRELAEPLYAHEAFEQMADASWGLSENGEPKTEDDGFGFMTQMAALYRPDGKERVIEFAYTDINKTYQIVCNPDGHSVVRNDFRPYTTRIETPYAVWRAIARGEISGKEAMFQKKYRVLGDFDVLLRWDGLFGATSATSTVIRKKNEENPKTNMGILLSPWMIIWILPAINPAVGWVLGIITATSLPLIWLLFKPTLFERISVFAIAGLSLSALAGADTRFVVPISYALFGVMWLITTFCKIPLTAYYSQNSYGGDKAFDNPLFMRTNRILTACWGVLFLLTPFWTYWLMTTTVSPFVGFINLAAPVIMGVFTAWFQKWYPAQWARR
ncbi:MAG: NAD(P)H-dependent oxidoreductase [Desulfovibrio sp.]|jgi:multimeric flavodoxin WrbA/putative sterol carrier protein|nr:NAD(P)H-dependent oxidoreductase [Desulfovibrio sp.]